MNYNLYIIRSVQHEWYYVGITNDIVKRLKTHNNGRVRSTRGKSPFFLFYVEKCENRASARDREKFYKVSSNKEKLIKQVNNAGVAVPIHRDLRATGEA